MARFNRNEFNGLLTDVLIDARRRQNMANLRPLEGNPSGSATGHHSTLLSTKNSNTRNFYIGTTQSMVVGGNDGGGLYNANLSDDEPIYDPVADDDYEPMPMIGSTQVNKTPQTMRQKLLKLNNSFG